MQCLALEYSLGSESHGVVHGHEAGSVVSDVINFHYKDCP